MFEEVLSTIVTIGFLVLLIGYVGQELAKPKAHKSKPKKGEKHKDPEFMDILFKHVGGFMVYAFKHTLGFLNKCSLWLGRKAGQGMIHGGRRFQASLKPKIRTFGRVVEAVGNGASAYPRIPGILLVFAIVGILSL